MNGRYVRNPIHGLGRIFLAVAVMVFVLAIYTRAADSQAFVESEPNNRFGDAEAVSVGSAIEATILPAGDDDWFYFDVNHQGELRVSITQIASELGVEFRIWNANRDTVTGWFAPMAVGGETTGVVDLPAGGRYYIELAASASDQTSDQPYALLLEYSESPDLYESNNNFGAAAPIPLGQALEATILPRADEDWYRVELDHHGEMRINLTDVPGEMAMNVRVWNSNRDTVTGWYAPLSAGGDTLAVVDIRTPGTYYLQVTGGDSDQRAIEPYTLQVDFTRSADQNELNGNFGSAADLALDEPILATILPAGEEDWFRFEVEHHGELTVSIRDVPENLAISVRAWNANRDTITGWFSPLAAGGETTAVIDLAQPGRYYLQLVADGDQRSIEPYTLQADFIPAPDLYERNNIFGQAAPLGLNRSVLINILPGGDEDWFVIETDHHGELQLVADQVPESLAVNYRVWNSNRDTITGWFAPLARGGDTAATVDLAAPGRYFIQIAGDSNSERDIQPFRFSNEFTPAIDQGEPNNTQDTATPVGLDETIPGNILPAGDSDWCEIVIDTPGNLHILVVNNSEQLSPSFRLRNADGNTMSNWFRPLAAGGNTEGVVEIAEPGTYYLELADADGNARSIDPYLLYFSMSPIDPADVTLPEPGAAGSDAENQTQGAPGASEADDSEVDSKVTILTSAVVGPVGATLLVNNTGNYQHDGARLQVLPDVVAEAATVNLGVAEEPLDDATPGLFPVGPFWYMSPADLELSAPVSVTLPLPPNATADDAYFVGAWDGASWTGLGGTIADEMITAEATQLGTFGVFCGALEEYVPVQFTNDSGAAVEVNYRGGPVPMEGDAATEYPTNCRPPAGAEPGAAIAQGESMEMLLRPGAYQFEVTSGESARYLRVAIPAGSGALTVSIGDDAVSSDDAAVQLNYMAADTGDAPNAPPQIQCNAAVPAGVLVSSIQPQVPLPSRFVQVGPLREDHLPPTNLEFGLEAVATDPEGGLISPYWTFGQPGTLPYVGMEVASGSTLGEDVDFQPTKAGVYRIWLTVYDEAELFAECRWDIVVEPNSKPDVTVFTGRTHVGFGRLDSTRSNAGPIVPAAMPGMSSNFTVNSVMLDGGPVPGSAATLCPTAVLGPFEAMPDPEVLVPAPAPVDTQLAAAGQDSTPRWSYPGRTCAWAVPTDGDLDAQFVRWEFPKPYYGAGTFYAAVGVPGQFHPDAPDGLSIGQLLRTAQQLNAYNAYVSQLYNEYGVVPSVVWEAWDDPCLDGSGVPQNPCQTALSEGGVTNIVADTSDGFDKPQIGSTPISVGPEAYEWSCANVFFMTLTPSPSNPAPGEAVEVTARLSPITEACPVFFTVVGTDGYARDVVISTNKDGEAHFTIPGAVEGTVDVVTAAVVQVDQFGVVDTETHIIEMEVTYQF